MPREFELIMSVPVPSRSGITHLYKSMHLADAFAIRLPAGTSSNPDLLARFILSHQPSWIGWLLKVRDTIVACFGLKTAKHLASLANRIGAFKVYSTNQTEIVLGEDDKHLDFRISILCSGEAEPEGSRQLVFSTVVQCHNRLGRAYIFVIAPFHRLVVKANLLRAARVGWPLATCP
ncbi:MULTISPECIES: DUF2867 domain-containing protein [unclassified Pseudomonas]|uniref:DUF2867 domain-containing protein n=1 Tax=unclassified Pseudomonas TaxID=196821 RepID=UPI001012C321|nr:MULTISPECIES: DUF2867 domain-containing protein [unclassified Pseudomonas]KAA0983487.1 DUF2867 domain-containing protein [Pseudomonas sp. ANT_J28]QAY94044.1 DUF2867 domain-containing protein [Pseudomonas sp. ACM7]TFB34378.1 DUF2867 domain-containing protein [Pseudomonas sp. F01002]